MTDMTSSTPSSASKKSGKGRFFLLLLILIGAIVGALFWWLDYQKYITTDDANLDSYRVDVASLQNGMIRSLHATEGDNVHAGDTLFTLSGIRTGDSVSISPLYYGIAPVSGIIGKRWVLPGDVVNLGQTIFTLNQGPELWVAVYLEETKFSYVHLEQQARFTLDAYDKLTFFGKIFYIGDNSASEFALVPPNNASGNYTKVTQRIPIKISIDSIAGDVAQKSRMKLVSGMSANVKIIKE